jgi:hypothetical protein
MSSARTKTTASSGSGTQAFITGLLSEPIDRAKEPEDKQDRREDE